jgi:hypothetical protein
VACFGCRPVPFGAIFDEQHLATAVSAHSVVGASAFPSQPRSSSDSSADSSGGGGRATGGARSSGGVRSGGGGGGGVGGGVAAGGVHFVHVRLVDRADPSRFASLSRCPSPCVKGEHGGSHCQHMHNLTRYWADRETLVRRATAINASMVRDRAPFELSALPQRRAVREPFELSTLPQRRAVGGRHSS